MSIDVPSAGLQLRSLVKPDGKLELSLLAVPAPTPAADEVVVRIEATPVNPSDIGLMFGAADIGPAAAQALRQRVVDELQTAFASRYSREISLAEALQPQVIAAYGQRATGTKYLINPNKGSS